MKIDVTVGEVPIKHVVCRMHYLGVVSVEISTPFDRSPNVSLGCQAGSGTLVLPGQVIDIYRVGRNAGPGFNPSRIVLNPTTPGEMDAFDGNLHELDWERWRVTLVAFPAELFDHGRVLASWDRYEPVCVDYLGSL